MLDYSKVGDCLIVKTDKGFHLIFDNSIGYNLATTIIKTLALKGVLNKDYEKIRGFRGDMTLRTSPAILTNKVKPCPTIVCYLDNVFTSRHDMNILEYCYFLMLTKALFEGSYRPHTPSA